jgi:hypothetical protein
MREVVVGGYYLYSTVSDRSLSDAGRKRYGDWQGVRELRRGRSTELKNYSGAL